MKNKLNKMFGILVISCMMTSLVSCGSTSGVRVTRDNITVLDHSGVGDDTTGERRKVKASNEFAQVEIEYNSDNKVQSNTTGKVINGLIVVEGLKLGSEVVKEGSAIIRN